MDERYLVELPKNYLARLVDSDLAAMVIILRDRYGPADGPVWSNLSRLAAAEVDRRADDRDGDVPAEAEALTVPFNLTPAEIASGINMLVTLVATGPTDRWRMTLTPMVYVLTHLVTQLRLPQ